MPLPLIVPLIGAGISAAKSIGGFISQKKNEKEAKARSTAFENSGVMDVDAASIKRANEPVSRAALDRQSERFAQALGTSVAQRQKGGLAAMGGLSRDLQVAGNQSQDMLAYEQEARNAALGQLAQAQQQSKAMQYGFKTGEIAGYGEREKQGFMQGMQGMADFAQMMPWLADGFASGGGANQEVTPPTDTSVWSAGEAKYPQPPIPSNPWWKMYPTVKTEG